MPRPMIVPLLIFTLLSAAWPSSAETEPADSPELAKMIAQGDTFMAEKHLERALDAYRKADKFAKHACATCNLRMFAIDIKVGDLSAALDDLKHAVAAARNDRQLAIEAHLNRAALLGEMAGKPSDKKLKEAEQELREALAIEPGLRSARFEMGTILLKENRDEEGVAELKAFTAMQGTDPRAVALALREIANPVLAREPLAPDFSFPSFDGDQISSAALRGKVVLLDFWATWCPPCRQSVPALVQLHHEYTGQSFEIIGISGDQDQKAWQSFLKEQHMDWPDYFDDAGTSLSLFGVRFLPTFVVMDRDGVVAFRQSGFDSTTPGDLREAINKALKKTSTAQPPPPVAAALDGQK